MSTTPESSTSASATGGTKKKKKKPGKAAMAALAAMEMPRVTIGPVDLEHGRLALGCWAFGQTHWGRQDAQDSRAAMEVAFRRGMNHFDTAEHYGDGRSERIIGDFLRSDDIRRGHLFLASKAFLREPTAAAVRQSLQGSLARMGVDAIDLYYLDWPRQGDDLRPVYEELRKARDEGLIRAVGASNHSIAQLEAARSVCEIHAHQFCYNLIWRFAEREVIPYCTEHGIAMVTHSSIAQGILAGGFPEQPAFAADDLRGKTVPFEPAVWPGVYAGIQKMKAVAARVGRPLVHLAIAWLARKKELTSMLVGARNSVQVNELAGAMGGRINDAMLDELTAISDQITPTLPETGNIFRFYP